MCRWRRLKTSQVFKTYEVWFACDTADFNQISLYNAAPLPSLPLFR